MLLFWVVFSKGGIENSKQGGCLHWPSLFSSQLFLAELGFYLEGIVRKGGRGGAWEGVALVGVNHHHSFKWTSETTIFRPNLRTQISYFEIF